MEMKNRLLVSLFLAAVVACQGSATSIPKLKYDGLKGNVKSLKEKEFEATEKFGEVVLGELSEVNIAEYDKDGNTIRHGTYFGDGTCMDRFEAVYIKGEIVSRKHEGMLGSSEDKVIERRKNYVKWKIDIGSKYEGSHEIIYDGLTEIVKNHNGDLIFRYFYDKHGFLLEKEDFYPGLDKSTRTEYEYDKNGLLLTETHYTNAKKEETLTYKYPSFDKKGNWTTQYVYMNGFIDKVVKREITYR